jgi:hypothetical protein
LATTQSQPTDAPNAGLVCDRIERLIFFRDRAGDITPQQDRLSGVIICPALSAFRQLVSIAGKRTAVFSRTMADFFPEAFALKPTRLSGRGDPRNLIKTKQAQVLL